MKDKKSWKDRISASAIIGTGLGAAIIGHSMFNNPVLNPPVINKPDINTYTFDFSDIEFPNEQGAIVRRVISLMSALPDTGSVTITLHPEQLEARTALQLYKLLYHLSRMRVNHGLATNALAIEIEGMKTISIEAGASTIEIRDTVLNWIKEHAKLFNISDHQLKEIQPYENGL